MNQSNMNITRRSPSTDEQHLHDQIDSLINDSDKSSRFNQYRHAWRQADAVFNAAAISRRREDS